MATTQIYRQAIEFFAPKMRELIDYALHVRQSSQADFQLTRPLLNFIKAESEKMEELLDASDARTNSRWFPLREAVATLKNFSTAGYELLHVYHSCQFYNLGNEYETFKAATEDHIAFLTQILYRTLLDFLAYGEKLGLLLEARPFQEDFSEHITQFSLPRDRRPQGPVDVKNRIDTLAISVLNTTEDVKNFKSLAHSHPSEWNNLDFDFLCETRFRILEVNMHTLQSLYDTHISDSDSEDTNEDLLKLRGNITGALHMLRIASVYIHFYERHMRNNSSDEPLDISNVRSGAIEGIEFARIMLKYLAKYIALFLTSGRKLCSNLLRKYCVTKSVDVKIPPYIGFHVRPSTLVAAIVLHYGCEVKMRLGDSEYDASQFLNITLANNYLDQKKRAFLMQELHAINFREYEEAIEEGASKLEIIKQLLVKLVSMNIIQVYKLPFDLGCFDVDEYKTLRETVYNAVVYLMNNDRQLGIVYNTTVTFIGPEQAVDDIALLADANYCETERGEDLPLPRKLDYLSFRRNTIKRERKP